MALWAADGEENVSGGPPAQPGVCQAPPCRPQAAYRSRAKVPLLGGRNGALQPGRGQHLIKLRPEGPGPGQSDWSGAPDLALNSELLRGLEAALGDRPRMRTGEASP